MTETTGFIGCGNMATSLIGGLARSGFPATSIWVFDTDTQKTESAKSSYGIQVARSLDDLVSHATTLVLAVKPNHVREVLGNIRGCLVGKSTSLLISIAAGICIEDICRWAGREELAVVRVMPNTPSLVGAGAAALYANPFVTGHQREQAESIMRSVGLAIWLQKETDMDIVTAVSGSGPAYFFYIMEKLQQHAETMGLSSEQARLLVLQTAYGAAKMAMEDNHSLEDLRKRVTSPGGTTEKAIEVLEEEDLSGLLEKALLAACRRSREISETMKG
ncbi:MAG: pyrroline-5-carboxylate reductase [Gammaproteobacteria bacterium]|nr:MAG: pyrroline-5-carboxylate reductase [Gammaproteobacteria bacterium]